MITFYVGAPRLIYDKNLAKWPLDAIGLSGQYFRYTAALRLPITRNKFIIVKTIFLMKASNLKPSGSVLPSSQCPAMPNQYITWAAEANAANANHAYH